MRIPLFKSYYDEDDILNVVNTMKSGVNQARSSNIEYFEKKFAEYVGTKHAVAFNSGTSALHAIMLAYGFGSYGGDEVIVPSFSFIATANTPVFVGAKPVFADIETETYGLDYEDVKRKINSNTKAIIIVHFAGCPARDTNKIKELAEKNGIIFIEDACESLGAELNGKKVGTFGDASVFSFCQNKIITMGEGGMVCTNNEDVFERLKQIRSHGQKDGKFVSVGYNWRLPSILASLGISQLEKIDWLIEKRREIVKKYDLNCATKEPKGFKSVYQMMNIIVEDRDKLQKKLSEKGVETKVWFQPIHQTPVYESYKATLPITESVSKQILSIPMFINITDEEIDYIKKLI